MKTSKFLVLGALLIGICFFNCSTDAENPPNDDLGQLEQQQTGEPNDDNTSGNLLDVEEIEIFPATHPLNTSVAESPVDPNSQIILENIGLDEHLFADFGSGTYEGAIIGIPFVVVDKDQPKVPITYRANDYDGNYGNESEPGPFPIPLDAPQEGGGNGDSHVIAFDVDNRMLYELYNTDQVGDGWEASSGAVFDLNTENYRPDGWTSADAAGLPIFPLLIRYGEIEKGEIDHPIRFTLERSKIYEGYVHPARHLISGQTNSDLLPMGAILRLKADFDITGFSPTNQIILEAMKEYGIILADAGANMFVSGDANENWNNGELRELHNVFVSDFEVVEMGEITGN
ncbi:MAG: hypothetical protein ACR2MT_02820 [Aurantibacter sp.]